MNEKRSEKIEMPMQTVVGSQLPLVIVPMHEENADYNPFEHRKLEHPTTYVSIDLFLD